MVRCALQGKPDTDLVGQPAWYQMLSQQHATSGGEPGELAFSFCLVLSAGGSLTGGRFHHLPVLLQMLAGTASSQPNSNPWHRLAVDRRDVLCWPAAEKFGSSRRHGPARGPMISS